MKRFALLVALALLFFTDPGLAQLQKFRAANGGSAPPSTPFCRVLITPRSSKNTGWMPNTSRWRAAPSRCKHCWRTSYKWLSPPALSRSRPISREATRRLSPGGINFFPFKLIVRPEIKTAAELHGKKLAISRFGSASDYAAQLAIEKLGGDPKQVTMLQLGGNPGLAALTSGTTHATVFSEPFASVAVKQGMRSLLDLADSGVPFSTKFLYRPPERIGRKASDDRQLHQSIHRNALSIEEGPKVRAGSFEKISAHR